MRAFEVREGKGAEERRDVLTDMRRIGADGPGDYKIQDVDWTMASFIYKVERERSPLGETSRVAAAIAGALPPPSLPT